MHLGDIKGAFLEAGPIPDKNRPLFAHQLPGGIPGLDPNDAVEILGNLYGANDAPSQWYREFDAQARAAGFTKSMFDPCLYYFRDSSSSAVSGVLGAHVDDTITGGRVSSIRRRLRNCVHVFLTASGALVPVSFVAPCTFKTLGPLRSPFTKRPMPNT